MLTGALAGRIGETVVEGRSQAPHLGRLRPTTGAAAPRDGWGAPDRAVAVAGLARRIEVKVATRRDEYEQAFRMLAANYQARGYEGPSPKLFRFTPYHVLPETVTFVAKHRDEVVATMSLVADNTILGLPMESLYGEEITALRAEGRRLGEVTSLADRDLSPREFLLTFKALIRLTMQCDLRRGGESWVIAVHPRHSRFYQKVIGFESLGPCRPYAAVGGSPAEAFFLDVPGLRARAPEMYGELLGEPLPDDVLTVPRRPPGMARYFGAQSTQSDLRTIEHVLSCLGRRGRAAGWGEGAIPGGSRPRAEGWLDACGS